MLAHDVQLSTATTERQIRRELAEEEERDAARGVLPPHEVTPSAFLNAGLDLEEQQYVRFALIGISDHLTIIHRRALKLHLLQAQGPMTASEIRDIHHKRVALHHCVHNWRQAQMVYMPCVASILSSTMDPDSSDDHPAVHVENLPLYLPSSLPSSLPAQLCVTGLSPGLAEKEIRLRMAQADDALAEVCRQRRIVTGLVLFKKLHISGAGQRNNTRIRALFKRFSNKTERVAERYRAARRALEVLDPGGAWKERLRVLRAEDIRGPGREDIDRYDRKPENSEKRREQSWIWLVPRTESGPDAVPAEEHLDASLRVEWARSRARAARWTEDALLLLEEMRRVLDFEERKADWWRSRAHLRSSEPEHLRHGLVAYAERQAALHERIASGHARYWLSVLKSFDIEPCWGPRYATSDLGSANVHESDSNTEDERDEDERDENIEITDDTYDDFVVDP